MPPSPEPRPRPRLAKWLFDRDISTGQAAEALGCSAENVRNMCEPFGSPKRTKPRDDLLERIVDWTGGEITAADFYPPHLNGHRLATAAERVPEDVQ